MKKLYPLLALTCLPFMSSAQLVVDTTFNDPNSITSFLQGAGISLSNLQISCHNSGIASFDASNANLALNSGMMLSSGRASDAVGPNDIGASTYVANGAGDADLDALSGFQTFDACVLEFDAVPAFNLLLFDYIFASEEYPEFVNASFNDVFAIFVSGPGYNGLENVAWIPGTTDPVAINSVNAGMNSSFYVANGDGSTAPYNSDSAYLQYDGMTDALVGAIPVTAGQSYHFKIAVADVSDGAFDSAVMLRANSFSSVQSTDVHETDFETFDMYPNPATSRLNIVFGEVEAIDVRIIDQAGRLLLNEPANGRSNLTLDLNQLGAGLYFVQTSHAEGLSTKTLIVR